MTTKTPVASSKPRQAARLKRAPRKGAAAAAAAVAPRKRARADRAEARHSPPAHVAPPHIAQDAIASTREAPIAVARDRDATHQGMATSSGRGGRWWSRVLGMGAAAVAVGVGLLRSRRGSREA